MKTTSSGFFSGLKEFLVVGLDGYANVEAAKNANNSAVPGWENWQPTERVAPVPAPDRAVASGSIISGVSNTTLMMVAAAGVIALVVATK